MANYNPNRLKEMAKQKNILDVASSLGLELKRVGHQYAWIEHPSFKIDSRKNTFSWYSKGDEFRQQDVIKMVEVINNMSFKEALHYLLETEAGVFDGAKIPKKEPFIYRVREANTFDYARKYLREERGLSDETIDFFLNKGIMVQGIHKDFDTGKTEPMIVFKHVDIEGKIVGGARQGIWYNKQLYPEKGRLKKTLYNSEGTSGVIVDIGDKAQFSKATSENPFTVYAFEAPIDMMSYYELHKNQLTNCRLVAMNGLNKGIISRAVVEALCADKSYVKKIEEKVSVDRWLQKIDDLAGSAGVRHEKLKIVLALDNDAAKFNPERGKIERPAKDFYNSFGINNIDAPIVPYFEKTETQGKEETKKIETSPKEVFAILEKIANRTIVFEEREESVLEEHTIRIKANQGEEQTLADLIVCLLEKEKRSADDIIRFENKSIASIVMIVFGFNPVPLNLSLLTQLRSMNNGKVKLQQLFTDLIVRSDNFLQNIAAHMYEKEKELVRPTLEEEIRRARELQSRAMDNVATDKANKKEERSEEEYNLADTLEKLKGNSESSEDDKTD